MNVIWRRLNAMGKNWRHVYKALLLLDYLIRNGSDQVVREAKVHLVEIQTLTQFQHIDETDKDVGQSVRERAKLIVELLRDDARIRAEREKAAKTAGRFESFMSSEGPGYVPSNPRSYDSTSFSSSSSYPGSRAGTSSSQYGGQQQQQYGGERQQRYDAGDGGVGRSYHPTRPADTADSSSDEDEGPQPVGANPRSVYAHYAQQGGYNPTQYHASQPQQPQQQRPRGPSDAAPSTFYPQHPQLQQQQSTGQLINFDAPAPQPPRQITGAANPFGGSSPTTQFYPQQQPQQAQAGSFWAQQPAAQQQQQQQQSTVFAAQQPSAGSFWGQQQTVQQPQQQLQQAGSFWGQQPQQPQQSNPFGAQQNGGQRPAAAAADDFFNPRQQAAHQAAPAPTEWADFTGAQPTNPNDPWAHKQLFAGLEGQKNASATSQQQQQQQQTLGSLASKSGASTSASASSTPVQPIVMGGTPMQPIMMGGTPMQPLMVGGTPMQPLMMPAGGYVAPVIVPMSGGGYMMASAPAMSSGSGQPVSGQAARPVTSPTRV